MGGRRSTLVAAAALALVLALQGCGSASVSPPEGPPTPSPPLPPAIGTFTATGVNPQVIHVFEGRKATFVNEDTRAHNIFSDAHPTHTQCGGAVNVGALMPGERREVVNLPIDACYFHDDNDPADRAFQGVLVVH